MKKLLKPIALLLCLAAATSCKKEELDAYVDPPYDLPLTDYEVVPDANDAFTFSFKNKTSNYGKVEWRFGDDTLKFDDNPTHTYLTTGKYTVDLKAFSKTTAQFGRKMIDINIVPDSVAKLTTTKVATTSGTATLQFSLNVKATVAKVAWTFNDAAFGSTAAATTKTEELSPRKTYNVGTFNTFTVVITTNKGSVITLTRNVTTEGIAEDITQKRIGYSSVLENGLNPANATANEGSSKLIDGNVNTKFGVYNTNLLNTWAFTVIYETPVRINLYAIANGNDAGNARDPRDWVLEGSNDAGVSWTQLDYQNNGSGFYQKAIDAGAATDATRYKRLWYYPVPTPGLYTHYRLRFPAGVFSTYFQLSEFQLFR
ncbi:PKD domain-containing protein [Mucilaginibacter myungsuensis]|uniref:PKD domain-containing protein n=1 Tax=Mucilaginibacter myungsuensis TaxID=649104 RepID=A0A929KXE9_9SPHI|nr:PKD domain-containing protein [Mucilaginibacter myungsuensis]MBE9662233.1 hypothetical protein [Mucilaginibacter myungsuensis]MDN3599331.1 PKD domain-containing protein [Mucilaginibacter myungsuensis]